MKRVSFTVAKALKEAGYPQVYETPEYFYTTNGQLTNNFYARDSIECVAPTYLDAWVWLCREKKIYIRLDIATDTCLWYYAISIEHEIVALGNCSFADPEEAIKSAIEYLVENNLIK